MKGLTKGLLWIVGILGLVAGILRATVLDIWTVPDDDPILAASIAPTLAPGDVVVLRRGGTPNFVDLVRCTDPNMPGRYIVGRILGEPGYEIESDGHSLKINGKNVRTERACSPPRITVTDPTSHEPVELECSIEEVGGAWYMRARGSGPRNPTGPTQAEVSPGNLFLVSDNRYHHYDSQDYGAVPREACTQNIIFRLWSKDGWMDVKNRMTVVR